MAPNPAHVVVLGDDPLARELVVRVLAQHGHRVAAGGLGEPVPGGAEAVVLDSAGAHQDRALARLAQLRDPELSPQPRVLYLAPRPTGVVAAWLAGADGVVARPFRATALHDELLAVLDRPETDRIAWRDDAARRHL